MKKILFINPFTEIYPPMNGGKMRAMNLLNQLSRHFEVTAIIRQDRASFSRCLEEYPAIRNCTLITPGDAKLHRDIFSFLPKKLAAALRYRWWRRSLKGPAEENFLTIYPILRQALKGRSFDHVILDDMGVLELAPVVRRKMPQAHIIYDAYNVNTRLAATELANGIIPAFHYEIIRQQESRLHGTVDAVFTCSDQDLAELLRMNDNRLSGRVVPNGVRIPGFPPERGNGRQPNDDVLFCGSLDYFPNQEGLSWFCSEVFPLLLKQRPSMRLLVVGRGEPGEALGALLRQKGIVFHGRVDSVSDYYRKAAIAIVPLLSGSGTRLKLLEAMGYAVPVVSTAVGAEGISYTDKKDILIANDPAGFAAAILYLLDNLSVAEALGREGFAFAKGRYDWDVVGEGMSAYLNLKPHS